MTRATSVQRMSAGAARFNITGLTYIANFWIGNREKGPGIGNRNWESGTGTGNRYQEPGIGNRKQDRQSGTGNWTWNQGQGNGTVNRDRESTI